MTGTSTEDPLISSHVLHPLSYPALPQAEYTQGQRLKRGAQTIRKNPISDGKFESWLQSFQRVTW